MTQFQRAAQFALLLTLTSVSRFLAQAGAPSTMQADADFAKEPGGTVLGRLLKGAAVVPGTARAGLQEITIDGWIDSKALRKDARDGFDVAVGAAAGASLHTGGIGTPTLGTAKAGTLFKLIEEKTGWTHVRRTAWVAATSMASPNSAVGATPAAGQGGRGATLASGTQLSTAPGNGLLGALEAPFRVEIVERRDGWSHVRGDFWVRDNALSDTPLPGSLTAADLLAAPEKYIGQTVEWSLQLIAVLKADELRPELPLGEPYVLARGPLPESGFVYMVIKADEVGIFRALQPLTKIRVRGTVRAGKTRYLPTPVINFVRRLD